LEVDGTEDGFSVTNLSTAEADHAHGLFFGAAREAIAANRIGETIVFGFCSAALVVRQRSRSATNADWPTTASIADMAYLKLDTVNNAFETASASQAASGFLPIAVLCESLSALATVASVGTGTKSTLTLSYITSLQKVFLRAM
jgi:hypothetical protein